MYYVYALYNPGAKKIYIGQTEDIKERLKLHNQKFFRGSYTSRFEGEWILIYTEQTANREEALRREKQLKSYQGRKFLRQYTPA